MLQQESLRSALLQLSANTCRHRCICVPPALSYEAAWHSTSRCVSLAVCVRMEGNGWLASEASEVLRAHNFKIQATVSGLLKDALGSGLQWLRVPEELPASFWRRSASRRNRPGRECKTENNPWVPKQCKRGEQVPLAHNPSKCRLHTAECRMQVNTKSREDTAAPVVHQVAIFLSSIIALTVAQQKNHTRTLDQHGTTCSSKHIKLEQSKAQ